MYFALFAILAVLVPAAVIYFAVRKNESPKVVVDAVEQDAKKKATKVEQAVVTEAKKVEAEAVTVVDEVKAKL